MNSTGFRPNSKASRIDNLRMEEGLLKAKTKQQEEIDQAYLSLFNYRRTLNNEGATTRKPSLEDQ